MANDDVQNSLEIRPVGEREALQRLNEALGLPVDTPYATLSNPDAMRALSASDGAVVGPVAVTSPAPFVPEPIKPLQPAPKLESVTAQLEPAPKPATYHEAAAPSASAQNMETKGEKKFASFIRNEEGKMRKGPVFVVAAVALGGIAYGIHRLRERTRESQSRQISAQL